MVEKLTLSGWTRGIGQEEVMETFSSSSPFSSSCSSLVPASSSSRTGLGLPLGVGENVYCWEGSGRKGRGWEGGGRRRHGRGHEAHGEEEKKKRDALVMRMRASRL